MLVTQLQKIRVKTILAAEDEKDGSSFDITDSDVKFDSLRRAFL